MAKNKIKYPNRDCKKCKHFPCFMGQDNCVSNFAQLGCTLWKE